MMRVRSIRRTTCEDFFSASLDKNISYNFSLIIYMVEFPSAYRKKLILSDFFPHSLYPSFLTNSHTLQVLQTVSIFRLVQLQNHGLPPLMESQGLGSNQGNISKPWQQQTYKHMQQECSSAYNSSNTCILVSSNYDNFQLF